MDGRTAAAVLGVAPGAPRNEIIRAFRARAKLAHPDGAGSNEAFIALHRAYEVLCRSAATDVSSPLRPNGPSSWLRPTTSSRLRSAVDLRDAPTRRRRTAGGAPAGADDPGLRAPRRDRRGLTFDDHLQAQLAR